MLKRTTLALAAVFISWTVLDILIHGILLESSYQATAHLWRPMEEMDMPLMHAVTFVYAVCFVVIYAVFVGNKSILTGIKFGALYGLAAGISMGFGSYSYMPIPLSLALTWFAGTLVEVTVAGALAGAIIREEA